MPRFDTDAQYRASLRDFAFWWPHAEAILHRHRLGTGTAHLASESSYPTVLCGDQVIKLYGHTGQWSQAFDTELAAYRALARDPAIPAPRLLASGRQHDWPYLVTSRLPGRPWHEAGLSTPQRLSAAADLGRHIGRLHALAPDPATERYRHGRHLPAALAASALPAHLAAQAENYVAGTRLDTPVFSHGDLFEGNILVDDGRVTGLLDWGDAMVIDRHNELAKIHLSVFGGDKRLLRAFLTAADWNVTREFPRRALAAALIRQATGITQHGSGFDNFFLVPGILADEPAGDLDALAEILFGV